MFTFKFTVVEVCDLEIYITYSIDIELYFTNTLLGFACRFERYFVYFL
jgi:hypothetical protein